jgi:hypothetical protein
MNPDVSFAQRVPKEIRKEAQTKAQKLFPNDPKMAQEYANQLIKIVFKTQTTLAEAETTLDKMSKAASEAMANDPTKEQFITTTRQRIVQEAGSLTPPKLSR